MNYKFRLYHYWRSSSSWRVRWALAIKKVSCEFIPIDLLSNESESTSHLLRNPLGYVPALEILDKQPPYQFLSESMAIIEWLEEVFPEPSLLSKDPYTRAKIRQLAEIINSGTQPLQNPTVAYLHSTDPEEQKRWNIHWISNGLKGFDALARETYGGFSVGDTLSFADLFLIPQCYNALRNDIPLSEFPTVEKIYNAAIATPSCISSAPESFLPH